MIAGVQSSVAAEALRIVVAIDVETTGLSPETDRIIEVGAAVMAGGEVRARFSELIRTDAPLPGFITKLTGITDEMLGRARPADEVLRDFAAFLPVEGLFLAHNARFDQGFLTAAFGEGFGRRLVDTLDLARIFFPCLPGHGLDILRQELGLAPAQAHRALPDAEATLSLWRHIVEAARAIPPELAQHMRSLLEGYAHHPLRAAFEALLGAEAAVLGRHRLTAALPALRREEQAERGERAAAASEPPEHIDEDAVAAILGTDGYFARNLPGYEERESQLQMATAVTRAFNSGSHLVVEAGTGIGKSLAYLLPAALWAVTNHSPVIVSTSTKNLQAQLMDKDLPLIPAALGRAVRVAMIKGRQNYVCVRKLQGLLESPDAVLDLHERVHLLSVLAWLSGTRTGDLSEMAVWERAQFQDTAQRLTSGSDECPGRACGFYGRCFLARARAKSLAADVVVANHSVVFAELGLRSQVLPEYRQIVFDEAHNLEEAATRHFSVELSALRLRLATRRLWQKERKGKGRGVLPALLRRLEAASERGTAGVEEAAGLAKGAKAGLTRVQRDGALLFEALAGVLPASGRREALRATAEVRARAEWGAVAAACEALLASAGSAAGALEALGAALREREEGSALASVDLLYELAAGARGIRDFAQAAGLVIGGADEGYVYWVEPVSPRQGGAVAWAAPIDVARRLFESVYSKKNSVILVSATLSVGGSCDFVQKRVGMDLADRAKVEVAVFGTPFDYRRQSLVMVPTFLPEPAEEGRDYAAELGQLLVEVFRLTHGRALTLFTSYEMLQRTRVELERGLAGDGIQILAQGASGSRESITTNFRRNVGSVLLGTHSFWEGVDIMGEALSCLVIARLPFAVFTDPVVEARCEHLRAEGVDAFRGYQLPGAVIRLRQGFGRLIRHRKDRGIVIIADRRIVARNYGTWFRRSLPTGVRAFPERDEFLQAVQGFFAGERAE